jgi:hypothetical protein
MKNKQVYIIISVLAYVVSACSTLILLTSMATTRYEFIIAIIITIIFEPTKAITFMKIFKSHKSSVVKNITITLWVILLSASIIASTGFMLNMEGKQANKALTESEKYKEIVTKKELLKNNIDMKKSEVEKLIQDKQSVIEDMTANKNKLPSNYISVKDEIQQKINKENASRQGIINDKNTEIDNLTKEYNNTTFDNITVEATTGYQRLFGIIAKPLAMTAEQVSFIFFFIVLGITPELIANVFFYYYNEEKKSTPLSPVSSFKNPRITQSYDNKLKAKIGFDSSSSKAIGESEQYNDNNDENKTNENEVNKGSDPAIGESEHVNEEQIKEYLKCIKSNSKKGICPGKKEISRMTGITKDTCEKIDAVLKDKGVLQLSANGKRTEIVKTI